MDRDSFTEAVQDAYRHLYDMGYLRGHPLVDILSEPYLSDKEKAWRLHRLLIEVIDELQPHLMAAPMTAEWRRHRLLVLRYQEGWGVQEIADELGISRRHYYREHDAAMLAVIDLLWQRRIGVQTDVERSQPSGDRLELLRREMAHIWQEEQSTALDQVVAGVTALLAEVAEQNEVQLHIPSLKHLPPIAVESSLLRQLLIGVLGYLIKGARDATLTLAATTSNERNHVELSVVLKAPAGQELVNGVQNLERISAVYDLAHLNQVEIQPVYENRCIAGLHLRLPCRRQHTVLVVDDNVDALHLFERYLVPNHYHVVTAPNAGDAIRRARQVRPDAILLDLMMPQQDGWDLLHIFRNDEATRTTPIIVCSILRQRELALAFGANDFLEKPVHEEALLAVLASNIVDM